MPINFNDIKDLNGFEFSSDKYQGVFVIDKELTDKDTNNIFLNIFCNYGEGCSAKTIIIKYNKEEFDEFIFRCIKLSEQL